MDFFTRISKQFSDFLRGMSPRKRMAMGGTLAVIVAGIISMFIWAGDQSFHPLMSNLSPEDSAQIMRVLREKNIPFRVDAGGKNIAVLPQYVDQLRMELAISGMPQSSVVGYEVFDKQNLGTTSFVQKVNQKRALEGELMRTINSIHGVRRSRVHLAIPQKSTFVEDQKKPSASVFLDLEPGSVLNEKQIQGIGTLVARAVEGMDSGEVAIMDALGRTLSKNVSDPISQLTSSQMEFKSKIERDMEKRIEDMMSRVVGEGHVVARVTADLDFSSVSETQTTYDGDAATIRSHQKNNQSMEGSKPTPQGVAGAQSNTPLGQPAPAAVKINDTKIANEVINYAVPETVRQTQRSPGSLKKLSVAVVVDGKISKTKNADGVTESKVEPWAPEKLKEFESLVRSAAGLDPKRGDTLEIKNMEFRQVDFEEAENFVAERERKAYIQNLILYGVVGLTIILFFLMVVRPFIKWITDNTTDGVETYLPQTLEELEKIQKSGGIPSLEETLPTMPDQVDPEKIESEMVKEKVVTMIDANPHKAALILRDWLVANPATGGEKEGGGGKDKGKTA